MYAGGGGVRRAATALIWVLVLAAAGGGSVVCEAQLRRGYYAGVCPNVESIVRGVVAKKIQQTPATVGATVRLFFHDCFVEGCDASVMVASTANNTAEKDHPINLSLAGDGFDTVIRARAAVDAAPGCRGKVSCADILAMATRDAIALSGGPSYAVELGRLDGLRSTASSVNGRLPAPFFNLDQLNQMFAANGLSQTDMVALSEQRTEIAHLLHYGRSWAHGGSGALQHVRGAAAGGGRDAGRRVRGAAGGVVPGGGGSAGGGGHGPRDAGELRQPVLPEPAGREGTAGVGPGAAHGHQVQTHRRRAGTESRRVRPSLRRRHHQAGPRRGQDGDGTGQRPPRLRRARLRIELFLVRMPSSTSATSLYSSIGFFRHGEKKGE
ncbi:peroxidase 63 isoform X2 [Sorghum bicolor]|uniref:Peroxidase n=1 Tax=Sorghum bicolor TaxID=4558 RepID=A0A1W0W1P5_SORBI|nr:peroxidase 63 isoform X2 [Sorghum bicolor]OQU88319.1 hypothetical protein SORBI_3002G010700 [Sorghum bicolor]|eukprot:XP_021308522.1 peroxidase 63 isoform X2 [Sorghum bicolor]